MCPGTVQYFKAENMVTHRCTMTLKSCSCEAGVLTPAESNYSNLTWPNLIKLNILASCFQVFEQPLYHHKQLQNPSPPSQIAPKQSNTTVTCPHYSTFQGGAYGQPQIETGRFASKQRVWSLWWPAGWAQSPRSQETTSLRRQKQELDAMVYAIQVLNQIQYLLFKTTPEVVCIFSEYV